MNQERAAYTENGENWHACKFRKCANFDAC